MKQVTIHNLAECTEQEVYDFIANHLLRQGDKSKTRTWCAYHSESGLMCAAGCLIPESDYNKDIEENSWQDLVDDEIVPNTHSLLISDLQSVHDDGNVQSWEYELSKLAKKWGLKPFTLNQTAP